MNTKPRSITSQKRWQTKHRSDYLQYCLPSAIRNQFHSSTYTIEFAALAMPTCTKAIFEREWEAIDQLQLIGHILKQSGRLVASKNRPDDERWFHKTRRDLFDCLGPSTRALLIQQG